MARFHLLVLSFFISFGANAFTPKLVCLDPDMNFIGWLTESECKEQGGSTPELKKADEQAKAVKKFEETSDTSE